LCYAYAKFPNSLIQLFRPKENEVVDATTYMLPRPVYVPSNFRMPLDNWQSTVQGLSLSYTMHWLSPLENARFNVGGVKWRIRVQEATVSDPFSPLRVATLFYLLPGTENSRLIINKITNGSTAVIERQTNG
jgi:hypothetical protein